MRSTFRHTSILALAAVSLAVFAGVPVKTRHAQSGPLDISGDINGAPFRIVVPAQWNGTLIEFARCLVDQADHPGEIDNRNATLTPGASDATRTTVQAALLNRGYALAASARKSNGWSVEEGLDDVIALVSYFKENVAHPTNTILWGGSGGSVIVLETAERNGGAFDGYMTTAAVGAGAPRTWDQALVLLLAYDVTFGMPAAWGAPGYVRYDIDYETEVAPLVSAQISDPANFGSFEFIRLVAGFPGSGIAPPTGVYPRALLDVFATATEAQAELERRAGGPLTQNITHNYTLTLDEKAYLTSLGVDATPLLDAMNARRNVSAPPESRNYLEHFAEYSGFIKRPVLTLHNVVDPLVVIAHERAYRDTAAAAERSDLLFQLYTTGVGHAALTLRQLLMGIEAIDGWTRTGTRPASSTFTADLGFLPDFVPPPWSQPR